MITHALRVVGFADEADAPAGEPNARWTLTDFYEQWVVTEARAMADRLTIKQDRESLRLWSALTGNPPLEAIDQETAGRFTKALENYRDRRGRPLAANTRRKHATHVQWILDRAGPQSRRDQPTAAILPAVPFIRRPPLQHRPPWKAYTLAEIGQWLDACRDARRASNLAGQRPGPWWQRLIVFGYNTGLRIDTILTAERGDVRTIDGRPWLVIPPERYKGGRFGHRIYLNAAAAEAFYAGSRRQARAFYWANWPTSSPWLHRCAREIQHAAGIHQDGRSFHGLRASFGSTLAETNPHAVEIALGHHRASVFIGHYASPTITIGPLDGLPQPAGWLKLF